MDQVQGGLWISERQWCDLVIWTPWLRNVGKELYIQRIERDDDHIEALEADLWEFHQKARSFELDLRRRPDESPIEGEPAAAPDDAVQTTLTSVMHAPTSLVKPPPLDISTLVAADIF